MSRSKEAKDLLTATETAFVAHYNGNATDAARLLGLKVPHTAAARIMKRPRVQKALALKQENALAKIVKESSKQATIDVAFLDEKLIGAIEICSVTAPDKLSPLLRLGYERAGILGKTAEQEDRVGAVKRTDGSIEVYRSKWLKASSGDTNSESTGSEPVVAED